MTQNGPQSGLESILRTKRYIGIGSKLLSIAATLLSQESAYAYQPIELSAFAENIATDQLKKPVISLLRQKDRCETDYLAQPFLNYILFLSLLVTVRQIIITN